MIRQAGSSTRTWARRAIRPVSSRSNPCYQHVSIKEPRLSTGHARHKRCTARQTLSSEPERVSIAEIGRGVAVSPKQLRIVSAHWQSTPAGIWMGWHKKCRRDSSMRIPCSL